MRRLWFAALVVLLSACGGKSSTPTTPTATLSSATMAGATATLSAVGQTSQIVVTGTYSDGSTKDITAQTSFVSDNSSVATVSGSGLVTAVSNGTASITATVLGKQGTGKITVAIKPTIISFTTDASTVQPGGKTTLRWETTSADSASIGQGVGDVPVSGSASISPSAAFTSYVLTATNGNGSVQKSLGVSVNYPDVEYSVTTSAAPRVSLITYAGSGGSTLQTSNASTPWSYTFSASSGAFLYVSAQNDNFNTCVTVSITIRGSLLKTGTSCGAFTIATVSGSR